MSAEQAKSFVDLVDSDSQLQSELKANHGNLADLAAQRGFSFTQEDLHGETAPGGGWATPRPTQANATPAPIPVNATPPPNPSPNNAIPPVSGVIWTRPHCGRLPTTISPTVASAQRSVPAARAKQSASPPPIAQAVRPMAVATRYSVCSRTPVSLRIVA